MVNKNIQMKKREGNAWDNLFPISTNENIYNVSGDNLNKQLDDLTNHLDHKITEGLDERIVLIKPSYTQEKIQGLLNNSGQFKFMPGTYRVNVDNGGIGYDVKDNTLIDFSDGAEVHMQPTVLDDYRIINIEKRENVTIRKAVVHGDKHTHLGSGGEWGHGISVRGSENITLIDVKANKCWGDGLYIGQATDYSIDNSENVVVRNLHADDNRRQGISVTGVKHLYMENLVLTNTSGTPPSAGIDFEPNNNRNELKNVVVNGVYTENNLVGIDVHVASALGSRKKEISLTINDHVSFNDGVGMGCRMPASEDSYLMSGRVVTNNPLWKNSKANGLHATWFSNKDIILLVNNPKIFNPNMSGSSTIASGAAIRLSDRSSGLPVGNVQIEQMDLSYPDTTPTLPLVVDGSSVKNLYFIDPIRLGHFTNIRVNYGSYYIQDSFKLMTDTSSAGITSVSNNYSSVYSSINREGIKRYNLSELIQKGTNDITFMAENGTIHLYPDDNSSILPYGTKGQVIQVSKNGVLTLRRKSLTEWQVVNVVGEVSTI